MIPKRLKKGDTIGIVAPSNYTNKAKENLLNNAINIIKGFGLNAKSGKYITTKNKHGTSAGTPEERASDINTMFADKDVKMIWCAQGGVTANEILELLDYELIKKNPKIFMGLSDNTVLLNAINKKTGLVTFYGPDAKVGNKDEYFDSEYSHQEFKKRLMDGSGEINKISEWKCVRKGKAKGKIMGGHLGCLLKLAGTEYWPNLNNSILALEGYHTDIRTTQWRLMQLKQMGVFDKLAGIVIGFVYGFDKDSQLDADGNRVYFEDLVLEATKEYDFPILKITEFGHKCPCTILPIGSMAELDAENKEFKIEKCVD